jgi:hypothetical protein
MVFDDSKGEGNRVSSPSSFQLRKKCLNEDTKVIISISISIVLILRHWIYINQQGNVDSAPSTAEITQPPSTPQLVSNQSYQHRQFPIGTGFCAWT